MTLQVPTMLSVLMFGALSMKLFGQEAMGYYTKIGIAQDMEKVIESFDRIAPMPYLRVDSTTIRLKRDSILSTLPDTVSIEDGRKKLASFIASYRLGHSQMTFWLPYLDSVAHFPFRVNIRNNRLFITANHSNDETITDGMEITTINGVSADRLIKELTDCMSLELRETREYYVAAMIDYLVRFYFNWNSPTFRMTLKNTEGQESTGDFVKVNNGHQTKVNVNDMGLYLEYPNDSTAKLRITKFHGFKRKAYRQFMKSAFREIGEKGIRFLVIDIRGNGGGNSNYLRELAAYVAKGKISFEGKAMRRTTTESKKHFRSIFFKWYTYPLYPLVYIIPSARELFVKKDGSLTITEEKTEKLKRVKYPFNGNVFLLVDRGTYSTSSMLTSCFQCHGIAKIVGIGPGEPTIGDGDGVDLVLPHTGCHFSVGTGLWFNPCYDKADQNNLLIPDIRCEQGKEYDAFLQFVKQNH
jgi:hypothetical protein